MNIVVFTPTGNWRLKTTRAKFPFSLRFAAATTIGRTTRFLPVVCPDVQSLMHEYDHAVHTNWLRYAISRTIGRLWGSTYWQEAEIAANAAALRKPEGWMLVAADDVRRAMPDVPLGRITHTL